MCFCGGVRPPIDGLQTRPCALQRRVAVGGRPLPGTSADFGGQPLDVGNGEHESRFLPRGWADFTVEQQAAEIVGSAAQYVLADPCAELCPCSLNMVNTAMQHQPGNRMYRTGLPSRWSRPGHLR